MEYKSFIKLGNKSINITKIDYIEFFDDQLTIEIKINPDTLKFKIKDDHTFNRLKSLIRMYSTEFTVEIEEIENDPENNKAILKD